MPIFEMREVAKFKRLDPSHRMISNEKLTMEGSDITIASQQFVCLNRFVNDPEYL